MGLLHSNAFSIVPACLWQYTWMSGFIAMHNEILLIVVWSFNLWPQYDTADAQCPIFQLALMNKCLKIINNSECTSSIMHCDAVKFFVSAPVQCSFLVDILRLYSWFCELKKCYEWTKIAFIGCIQALYPFTLAVPTPRIIQIKNSIMHKTRR